MCAEVVPHRRRPLRGRQTGGERWLLTRGSGNNLPLWRRLRRRVYWLLLAGLMKAAAVMPLAAGRRLTEGLALLALEIRSRERRQGLANLALAFPELPAAGRAALLRSSARALGRNLFDTLAAPRVLACGVVSEGPPPPGQDPGFSAALARLAAKGRGVLLLTGHIGCWELLGAWTAQLVRRERLGQLAVVTGTIHNEAVDRLVQGRRRDLGMKVLPREQGVRPLLEHLRQQGVLAVLQDQNTRTRNLPAPFFGHPAPTPAGLALLALKYGIPVLPFALARSDMRYAGCLPWNRSRRQVRSRTRTCGSSWPGATENWKS